MKKRDSITFSGNDDLEIYCIAPWQIELFGSNADIFMNSHSFVEMPNDIVKNYVNKFEKFSDSKNSAVALATYDCYNLESSLDPNSLPENFTNREFAYFEAETLINSNSKNLFFVSPGKLSV